MEENISRLNTNKSDNQVVSRELPKNPSLNETDLKDIKKNNDEKSDKENLRNDSNIADRDKNKLEELPTISEVFKKASKDEKILSIWLFGTFTIITIITTFIHLFHPELFRVPDVQGPRLYPELDPLQEYNLMVFINLLIASFAFYHSMIKYGLGKSSLFFIGSMVFAGLEENEWILISGRLLGHKTYFFAGASIWFFEIPLYTTLGWYMLTYASYEIMNGLFPKKGSVFRASGAGIIAMVLDFFTDPVLVNMGMVQTPQSKAGFWVWQNEETLRLFSIPMMNFVGWWMLIMLFLILYEHTIDNIDKGKQDWFTATRHFFLTFILLWIIMYVSLHILEYFFMKYWAGVNIIPMDFPYLEEVA